MQDAHILVALSSFFIIVDDQFCKSDSNSLICPEFSKENSFLQQAIRVLFEKWCDVHRYMLYETDSMYIMDTDAIVRLTARDMTEGCMLPPYTLFNQISAMRSEGAVCRGILSFSGNTIDEELVKFEKSIQLSSNNLRYIRKLLEMTGGYFQDDYALFVTTDSPACPQILGLISYRVCIDKELYSVEFDGLLKWTLCKGENKILSYEEGSYLYRQEGFSGKLNILNSFLSCTNDEEKIIYDIAKIIWGQEHGTMAIIFDNTELAKEESQRLANLSRGFLLQEPAEFSESRQYKKLLLSLSSIDGALFFDKKGSVFGFGIIVDGDATIAGTPQRGARYNSAKNYVTCCKENGMSCCALVISEDRSLDVLLPP